jgi:hypothetical protein
MGLPTDTIDLLRLLATCLEVEAKLRPTEGPPLAVDWPTTLRMAATEIEALRDGTGGTRPTLQ